EEAAHFDHEHDRVSELVSRIELGEGVNNRALDDVRLEEWSSLALAEGGRLGSAHRDHGRGDGARCGFGGGSHGNTRSDGPGVRNAASGARRAGRARARG